MDDREKVEAGEALMRWIEGWSGESGETTDASQEDIEAIWFGAWAAGREALALENTRLRGALGFAASVIKSGESWSATCAEMIGGALRHEK
jgi:hypothetical protein